MTWKKVEKKSRRFRGMFVSVYPGSNIYVSAEAMDRIGNPEYVVLFVDLGRRAIAIAASTSDDENAYKTSRLKNATACNFSAKAAFKRIDSVPHQTFRCKVEIEDDMLVFIVPRMEDAEG